MLYKLKYLTYMEYENKLKLRIKHPSGAEFEAEGPENFIIEQKRAFIEEILKSDSDATILSITAKTEENLWQKLISFKNGIPYLLYKTPEIKASDSLLIIMAAIKVLKKIEEISAIKLSKAIKLSGYSPKRLDRELSEEIKSGMISALGTKRNRIYRINPKGMEEAYLKALKIVKEIK